MNAQNLPKSFWIISVVALIWNLLGVMSYLSQAYMSEETFAALPQNQQDLMNSTPAWVTAAFALAVFGGTLGCIALLLRKAWAKYLFLISLVAVIAQMIYSYLMANAMEVYGVFAVIMSLLVIVIAGYLYYYAKECEKKGWIN